MEVWFFLFFLTLVKFYNLFYVILLFALYLFEDPSMWDIEEEEEKEAESWWEFSTDYIDIPLSEYCYEYFYSLDTFVLEQEVDYFFDLYYFRFEDDEDEE